MSRCGTISSYSESDRNLQAVVHDSGNYILLKIKYIVILPQSESNNMSALIKEQHINLNNSYSAQNLDITKVPKSGNYNYHSVIGKSKIRFLPNDPAFVNIVYHDSNQLFFGIQDSLDFATFHSLISKDSINVFITKFDASSPILGIASEKDHCCAVDYRTVGGENKGGSRKHYDMGKTLIHEIGHVLSIPHPFESGCSNNPKFNDIPPQKYPNFGASFEENVGGEFDNHDMQCKNLTHPPNPNLEYVKPYSCSTCDNNGKYEMYFNFMDYVHDENMFMFTKTQVHAMRQFLFNHKSLDVQSSNIIPKYLGHESVQNYIIDYDYNDLDRIIEQEGDTGSVSGGNGNQVNGNIPNENEGNGTSLTSNSTSTSTSTLLVGISITIIIFFIIALIIFYLKKKHS
jgi:hypothetical protein